MANDDYYEYGQLKARSKEYLKLWGKDKEMPPQSFGDYEYKAPLGERLAAFFIMIFVVIVTAGIFGGLKYAFEVIVNLLRW